MPPADLCSPAPPSGQCRPGWDSYGLGSCYLLGPGQAVSQTAAQEHCLVHGGHLPVIEDAAELSRLAEFGDQWTNASWDGTAWVWGATGEAIDFTALGVVQPPAGEND